MKIQLTAAALVLLAACTSQSPSQQIAGEWQGVSVYNASVEALLQEQQFLLDTIGRQTPPEQYQTVFGVQNLDSFRKAGNAALAQMRQEYESSASASHFSFRRDGMVVFSYPAGTDSAEYSLEGDTLLVLDEQKVKGVGDSRLLMRIEQLGADSLTLLIPDARSESRMTFRKVSEK